MPSPLITELDSLMEILEAQIPANPASPKNEKLRRSLEQALAKYFQKLEGAFPYSRLDRLYNKYVKESLASETSGFLDPLLASFSADLTTTVSGYLAEIYMSGSADMVTWGKTKGGIPIAYEGPPIEQANSWAKKHGAKLVTEMDVETKRRLGNTIASGIKNKRGIPGLARDIRGSFDNMTKYRSELIAKTETRNALFNASQDRMEDMGITGKEWILGAGGIEGNCPECRGNAAQGIISVDQEFSTPQNDIHPGCTCAIAPAKLKG